MRYGHYVDESCDVSSCVKFDERELVVDRRLQLPGAADIVSLISSQCDAHSPVATVACQVDVKGKVVHLTALPVVEQPAAGADKAEEDKEERESKRAKTENGSATGGAGEQAEKEEPPATPVSRKAVASVTAWPSVGSVL